MFRLAQHDIDAPNYDTYSSCLTAVNKRTSAGFCGRRFDKPASQTQPPAACSVAISWTMSRRLFLCWPGNSCCAWSAGRVAASF